MFFKKQERLLDELDGKIDTLQKQLLSFKAASEEAGGANIMKLSESFEKAEKQLSRQSASVEDLIDEFQEYRSEQEASEKTLAEAEKRETQLLELAVLQREQFALIRNVLLEGSGLTEEAKTAWSGQLSMMDKDASKAMALCGMQEAGSEGEIFDAAIHEILQVSPAPEQSLDGRVSRVYSKGILYHGQILKKAKVEVYKGNIINMPAQGSL